MISHMTNRCLKLCRPFVAVLLISFASDAFACTTAVISARASANGRPMLWKQRDSGVKYNYVDHFVATDSTFAFTAVVNTADTLRQSVWSGANSEGFAIMNSMSYGLSPIVTEHRPFEGIIMKRALESCRTVDDFEACLKSLPKPNGLETNFGVIDAYGGAAYFETHDLGYTRFDAGDVPEGFLVRSNYSVTGREGEGKGYDRYEIAFDSMQAEGSGLTAEWIIDNLGRNPVISRKTTISSTVIEGVADGEPKNSSVIWTAPGYTPASYAIATWVAAADRIAWPLKSAERGSALNELARDLQLSHFREGPDAAIMEKVREAEKAEFSRGRRLDALVRSGKVRDSDFAAYNRKALQAFKVFETHVQKTTTVGR